MGTPSNTPLAGRRPAGLTVAPPGFGWGKHWPVRLEEGVVEVREGTVGHCYIGVGGQQQVRHV